MINTVTLVGRIAKDVKTETVNTKNGQITKVFGQLAVDNGRVDANGNKDADFISFEVWGKTANVVAQYTTKGSLVGLQGALRSSKYTDKNGNTQFKMVVRVNSNGVSLLESKQTTQNRRQQAPAAQNQPYNQPQQQNNGFAQQPQGQQMQSQNNGFANQQYNQPQQQNNGFAPANDDPFVSGNGQF